MRDIKELLQIVLDNLEGNFSTGLCIAIHHIKTQSYIDIAEKHRIYDYLELNLLKGPHKYNWAIGDINPRVKWLEQQIKKLENEK